MDTSQFDPTRRRRHVQLEPRPVTDAAITKRIYWHHDPAVVPHIRKFMVREGVCIGRSFNIDAFRRGKVRPQDWYPNNPWWVPSYMDHCIFFRQLADRRRPALIVAFPYVGTIDEIVNIRDRAFIDGFAVELLGDNWYGIGTVGLVFRSRDVYPGTFRAWLASDYNPDEGNREYWRAQMAARAGSGS